MKKNIRLVFLCLSLLLPVLGYSQTHLVLTLKSGQNVSIELTEMPKITFDEGIMAIGTENFLVSNVSKYTFDNGSVGIEIESNDLGIDLRHAAEGYITLGNSDSKAVVIYNISGVQMPIKITAKENRTKLDFSALPSGTYIMSVGNEHIKIQKR